jgi:hypothetical protein
MSHSIRYMLIPFAALVVSASIEAQTSLGSNLEMTLLPGYVHQPLQGIDSIVGRVAKKGGLTINYDIGGVTPPGAPRFGGSWSNQAERYPAKQALWRQKQTIGGHDVHIVHTKSKRLIISMAFKKLGINISAEARTPQDVADVLLMALTVKEKKKGK